jgi:hypothetical protein
VDKPTPFQPSNTFRIRPTLAGQFLSLSSLFRILYTSIAPVIELSVEKSTSSLTWLLPPLIYMARNFSWYLTTGQNDQSKSIEQLEPGRFESNHVLG